MEHDRTFSDVGLSRWYTTAGATMRTRPRDTHVPPPRDQAGSIIDCRPTRHLTGSGKGHSLNTRPL